MADWLIEPFSRGIMQRALAELVILSLACGPIGVWVLLYRQSYAAESIAHAMLPGLVVAALIGLPLVAGGAAGLVLAALAIAAASGDQRLGPDVGVAVAITGLFGLGALLALTPEAPARLNEMLFGDPLGVIGADLGASTALAGGVALALVLGHRQLSLSAFDRTAARSLGARPRRWELILLVLLIAGTLAAVQALGNLLVIALILAPGAAALRLTDRLPSALALSVVLAALAGVAGLLTSFHWHVAAGAAIALAALGVFAVALLAPGRSA